MHNLHIQLSDPAFTEVSRIAAAKGVKIEDLIASHIEEQFVGALEVTDIFFTSDILIDIDEAVAEAREGQNLSMDEMRQQLSAHREAWLQNHRA